MQYEEKLNSLFKTGFQKDIKLAFDIFEILNWNFNDIIKYIFKNHLIETRDSRIKAISNRKFCFGSLHFNYNVIEDWEAPEITTNYYLELGISLKDIDDKIVKSAKIKNIQSETIEDPFWGMGENDFLSFTKSMDECTNKIFENIDTKKNKNLYGYIFSYYSEYIDKINKKELFCIEKKENL